MKNIYETIIEEWPKNGGLITKALAAKILNVTKGRITQMIKEKKIKEIDMQKNKFLSYSQIIEIAQKKQNKNNTCNPPEAKPASRKER